VSKKEVVPADRGLSVGIRRTQGTVVLPPAAPRSPP